MVGRGRILSYLWYCASSPLSSLGHLFLSLGMSVKVGTICPGFYFYQQVPGLESSISRPTYDAYLSCLSFPILSDQNWRSFEVGTCMGPHFAGDKTQEPRI